MSLLSSASVWVDTPKKRTPTIRKTIKKTSFPPPTIINDDDFMDHEENESTNGSGNNTYVNSSSIGKINEYMSSFNNNNNNNNNNNDNNNNNMQEIQKIQESKQKNVNVLLDKMNDLNIENDGSGLYNYVPPPPLQIFKKEGFVYNSKNKSSSSYENNELEKNNNNYSQNSTTVVSPFSIVGNNNNNNRTDTDSVNLANYSQAYEIPQNTKPYYTKSMGNNNNNALFEDKILDKIQYLTHLMEEMQHEKTTNITEEFILYTMLGVFVIYVVDSFTRIGKYTR
jgi:hypothetical protein